MTSSSTLRLLLLLFCAALSPAVICGAEIAAAGLPPPQTRETFLKLCDLACDELKIERPPNTELYRKRYIDSYAIRSLAVAYDLTGNQRYLQACQDWSDKVVAEQAGMTPKGAYYMNYGRKPGETTGNWYVADCGSIGMGVLATAARTAEPAAHAKYLNSVRAFADLVLGSYVKEGGITDGLWKYDGPWWCSTGTFGSLTFLLYGACGDERYLQAGLHAIDWLNTQDFEKTPPTTSMTIDEQGAAFIFYFFEAYSAGLPYILPNTDRHARVVARLDDAMSWIRANQHTFGGTGKVSYYHNRGAKGGGLPFHLYIWSKYQPDSFTLTSKADAELGYIISILYDETRFKEEKNNFSQLMHFSMLSMAERLSPGSLYRR